MSSEIYDTKFFTMCSLRSIALNPELEIDNQGVLVVVVSETLAWIYHMTLIFPQITNVI